MTTIFITCATIGGTVLLFQLAMSLLGLTDQGSGLADDMPSEADLDFDPGDVHDGQSGPSHTHINDWLFGVISFRTVVPALTFFGLSGMAARSAGMAISTQWAIALVCGLAAMYAMHALMRGLSKLAIDGTIRMDRAIGKTGTVYLPIAAQRAGAGKIQLTMQQRLMEFNAVTSSDARLPAGAKVVVTAVIGGDTLEVEPLREGKPILTSTEPV